MTAAGHWQQNDRRVPRGWLAHPAGLWRRCAEQLSVTPRLVPVLPVLEMRIPNKGQAVHSVPLKRSGACKDRELKAAPVVRNSRHGCVRVGVPPYSFNPMWLAPDPALVLRKKVIDPTLRCFLPSRRPLLGHPLARLVLGQACSSQTSRRLFLLAFENCSLRSRAFRDFADLLHVLRTHEKRKVVQVSQLQANLVNLEKRRVVRFSKLQSNLVNP